ncbi:hypothetical protein AB1Y20_013309 [Prymnesium parvum]|uniref:RNA helicase n=1 Tax=Prymnesium parvum TaxID=97485 RepID=A0AB34ILS9_PRYPA
MVSERPVAETTSRLIRALSTYGASSVDAAHSALGRLMSWVVTHHPEARVVEGSHVSDFLAQERPSAATIAALAWLRDHCGLAIPARGPACRPYRGLPPAAPRTKESLSLSSVVGLEYLAVHHPSAHVRGQAGGWSLLARLALRVEQAQSCVINAIVTHEFEGHKFTFVVGAVRRDKNPNPALRRPRPVWGVIVAETSPYVVTLCLERVWYQKYHIRATAWVAAPLRGAARVDASLQALLRLPPISLSHEEAGRHHGHSAKRFLLNVAEASGAFSSVESTEIGRFSLSTAQSHDLEPVAALLQAHSMRASVLPDIYAGKAKVARVFDLLAKTHLILIAARAALARDPGTRPSQDRETPAGAQRVLFLGIGRHLRRPSVLLPLGLGEFSG